MRGAHPADGPGRAVGDDDAERAAAEHVDVPRDFGAAVADVVRSIPPGHAMTYGDVAAVLGSRASRAVGRVMAFEGADLPWWRVVRAGGWFPTGHEQRALDHHRAEGTPLTDGTAGWHVDLRRARWSPDVEDAP